MPDSEPIEEDKPRVRSAEELEGLLRCIRCGHIERLHSEEDSGEADAVNCHIAGCACDGFVSPVGTF